MICPYCGSYDIQVISTKPDEKNNVIKRRRECNKCNSRFTTEEKIKKELILVKKKDKSIERFDEIKIEKSIRNACIKTSISEEEISELISDVIYRINNLKEQEISTYLISSIVQEEIKSFDLIAYVKYILITKEITDIYELEKEIELLK